jgi:hypothetical protein
VEDPTDSSSSLSWFEPDGLNRFNPSGPKQLVQTIRFEPVGTIRFKLKKCIGISKHNKGATKVTGTFVT